MEILVASENDKKRAELAELCAALGVRVLTPAAVGGLPPVVEDADTFAGNARKKAVSGALASRRWCLGDDSGLEVDALDGQPGVRSARWAGPFAAGMSAAERDRANNRKLLAELAGVPEERRTARFCCALALARPDGTIALCVDGSVEGRILDGPRGGGGFGYDPLFLFDESAPEGEAAAPAAAARGKAFAELSGTEKAAISHRGRALRELAIGLRGLQRETQA